MRRIYYKKGKKDVREEALEQFRATRGRLEADYPHLMKELRASLARINPGFSAMEEDSALIPVDRRKNLATVLKYLESNPNAAALRSQLVDLLGK